MDGGRASRPLTLRPEHPFALLGEPAVAVLDTYGQYLWYLSLAILAGMLFMAFRNRDKKKTPGVPGPPRV